MEQESRIKSAGLVCVCLLSKHAATQVSVQTGPRRVPHRFSYSYKWKRAHGVWRHILVYVYLSLVWAIDMSILRQDYRLINHQGSTQTVWCRPRVLVPLISWLETCCSRGETVPKKGVGARCIITKYGKPTWCSTVVHISVWSISYVHLYVSTHTYTRTCTSHVHRWLVWPHHDFFMYISTHTHTRRRHSI